MKEKRNQWIRGSISILLIIVMLPMMTMAAIIVDSCRINMARSMVSSAGDLAINSALADYDTILKDVYGLFAMSQNKTDAELAADIKNYFVTTLVSYGVVTKAEAGDYVDQLMGDFDSLIAGTNDGKPSNFLNMTIEDKDVSVTKAKGSSLADAGVMRSQIVEYMKYRAPINFGLSFLDSVKAFKNVSKQTEVVQKQVEAQESTQDVTDACEKAIKAIREYDKIVKYIEGKSLAKAGTNTTHIVGKNHNTDGLPVGILEYHTQVDKYRSTWGDNSNYEYLNKINLVFLAKSPSVDKYYLSKLKVNSAQWFVKTSGAGINYSNSDINVNPSLEKGKDAAKNQVISQINKLENTGSAEYKNASTFVSKNFVDQAYLGASKSKFSNEDSAISTFIEYEKFLLNDPSASIKYDDVKIPLESLYTLGKYYDNWYGIITSEINKAKQEMDAANSAVSTASSSANTQYSRIQSKVTEINDANKNYTTSYEFLKDFGTLQGGIQTVLSQTEVTLPTATDSIGGKSFTKFDSFMNVYKTSNSDTDYIYLKSFKNLINNSKLKGNKTYKTVCSAAQEYLDKVQSGKTNKSFSDYMVNEKKVSPSNELFVLLNHLYSQNNRVNEIQGFISKYNEVKSGYQNLVNVASEKTEAYNALCRERTGVADKYKVCLQSYENFSRRYQNSLYNYTLYIARAKDIINNKVTPIKTQFTNIKNNLSAIITQLGDIEKKLGTAKSAIEAYNKKLDSWNSANTTYANGAGADSFSKQNSADYESAKTQFNIPSLETLVTYIGVLKSEYNELYKVITDTTHFKYGSKKIDSIGNADEMKTAASAIKGNLSSIVTPEAAKSQFANLYNADKTSGIVLENGLYILDPVLPLQFLKYLNETYPDPDSAPSTTPTATASDGTTITVSGENADFDYDKTKSDLKSNDNKPAEDEEAGDQYGYKYKTRTARGQEGKDMPSQIAAQEDDPSGPSNKKFGVDGRKDDPDKINASGAVGEQGGIVGSLLGGIGNIISDSVETTYILSYIFENFSYNTLVQDMAVENKKLSETPWKALTEAKEANSAESIAALKPATTLSNYNIDGKNNYLYGAEIEYILFGNKTASKNVTSMKASIYAIRFAFNCIYAFTNSEIKNTTMSVGLAVQAATLGVVPYQIVQVVMQLALAAAESAMDLKLMSYGVDVAVIKSNNTWSLSLSAAVKGIGEAAAGALSEIATNTIQHTAAGLQKLVDAGAAEINGAITNLSDDLGKATQSKLNEVIDAAVTYIQNEIESVLNEIQFTEFDKAKGDLKQTIESKLSALSTTLVSDINAKFGGNPVADAILPSVTGKIEEIISTVKTKITTVIGDASTNDVISSKIADEMTQIKLTVLSAVTQAVNAVKSTVEDKAKTLTAGVSDKLGGYITQTANELSEEASEKIKTEVTNATNDFINEFLSDSATSSLGSGATGTTSSSVASIIKFGYKEYLMLFVFIGLFVDSSEEAMLIRLADVMQLNITNASKKDSGAQFKHKKGTGFRMSNAFTYVSVKATADLDMLFMNMDFFTTLLKDDDTDVEGQLTPAANIVYNGLGGY